MARKERGRVRLVLAYLSGNGDKNYCLPILF